jgi:hypothetical protein
MADTGKPLHGKRAEGFLAELLAREPGVSQALAARLAARCMEDIAQLRVRQICLLRSGVDRAAAWNAAVAAARAGQVETPEPAAPSQPEATVEGASRPAGEPAFDPYAFSVVALYARQGEAGLMARLEAIGRADHLAELARAQHISLAPALLDGPPASLVELRTAIVRGVEQRIAERRAAAG